MTPRFTRIELDWIAVRIGGRASFSKWIRCNVLGAGVKRLSDDAIDSTCELLRFPGQYGNGEPAARKRAERAFPAGNDPDWAEGRGEIHAGAHAGTSCELP